MGNSVSDEEVFRLELSEEDSVRLREILAAKETLAAEPKRLLNWRLFLIVIGLSALFAGVFVLRQTAGFDQAIYSLVEKVGQAWNFRLRNLIH